MVGQMVNGACGDTVSTVLVGFEFPTCFGRGLNWILLRVGVERAATACESRRDSFFGARVLGRAMDGAFKLLMPGLKGGESGSGCDCFFGTPFSSVLVVDGALLRPG